MKKRYVRLIGAATMLTCGAPLLAQTFTDSDTSSHHNLGYFAGGYTAPVGDTADFVNGGWNIGTGGQWQLGTGPVSLRMDFAYGRNNATNQLVSEGTAVDQTHIDHGWSEIWSNDLDAVIDLPLSPNINVYLLGGGGGAIRRISLTQTVTNGGVYCNNWAGFCTTGHSPGDVLVDSRTTGRWEWNTGVGVRFTSRGRDFLFIEARYMEMETPVPTRLIPLRIGLIL